MQRIYVEYMRLDELSSRVRADNPKDHDVGELHQSIDRFGYTESVILDEATGTIAAGHGRLKTLNQKMKADPKASVDMIDKDKDGMWLVPVQRGKSWESELELKAYLVASNRLVSLGGWDDEALTKILQEHVEAYGDADIALSGLGYDSSDLDQLIESVSIGDTVQEITDKNMSHVESKTRFSETDLRQIQLLCNAQEYDMMLGHFEVIMNEHDLDTNYEVVEFLLKEHLGEWEYEGGDQ